MYQKITLFLSCILLFNFASMAQDESQASTLQNQFEELKKKSGDYQDYEVIKKYTLNQFWKVVQDSVNTLQTTISNLENELSEQKAKVNEVNQQIKELQVALEESEYASTRMNFLGAYIPKDVFMATAGVILAALLIALGFIGVKFRINEKVIHRKKKDFEELSGEFEEYRKIVRQREMKIKRELQTANNKLEEQQHKQTAK